MRWMASNLQGPTATRNVIGANIIGLGPGGGYRFGTGNPGNGRNGVWIQDSTQNQVGGPDQTWGNVISSNGVGILINGITSSLNIMQNNLIGLTADGKAVKGNTGDGVSIFSPQNTIGPGNVISGNLRGVRISGADASQVTVLDNLIGTDITGKFDLGNALEGIRIENATDAVIQGDGKGSQVISGNHQGVVIAGPTSTRNLVARQPDRVGQERPCSHPQRLRGDRYSGCTQEHDRRNHSRSPELDLGQPLGRAVGRSLGYRQPRSGQHDRTGYHGQGPHWAMKSTA